MTVSETGLIIFKPGFNIFWYLPNFCKIPELLVFCRNKGDVNPHLQQGNMAKNGVIQEPRQLSNFG